MPSEQQPTAGVELPSRCDVLIVGEYQTLDLSRFGYQRVLERARVAERGVR